MAPTKVIERTWIVVHRGYGGEPALVKALGERKPKSWRIVPGTIQRIIGDGWVPHTITQGRSKEYVVFTDRVEAMRAVLADYDGRIAGLQASIERAQRSLVEAVGDRETVFETLTALVNHKEEPNGDANLS